MWSARIRGSEEVKGAAAVYEHPRVGPRHWQSVRRLDYNGTQLDPLHFLQFRSELSNVSAFVLLYTNKTASGMMYCKYSYNLQVRVGTALQQSTS